ncbi:DUF4158 domain-containing protein [Actinomadura sp. NAK00032]|uniref:DUF4158 domain-containing protein n=1 Tax=Actinomadura sp. NAK00032 TaxID=2742128 RepID=UPI00159106AD|nr:DUF4158 domain-containing protein [Actinomadura sp. NAK00032]QKW36314.1 DUF4158 domain-containing protein [Actinomadura sp. NAK00032]
MVGDELTMLSDRRAPTKPAFALMLRFHALHGRFPKDRHELPDQAVGYVARLVKVAEADLSLYEWDGRTSKGHRKKIREYLGFRECGLTDSDKAALWLAANVCDKERHLDRVREALLAQLWEEKLEQPAPDRIRRIVGSAISQAEKAQTALICNRVSKESVVRMVALIAHSADRAPRRTATAGMRTRCSTRRR